MIKRRIDVELDLTPDELAAVFCGMDGEQQAGFFNAIAKYSDLWPAPFPFQVQAIVDSLTYTEDARRIMRVLGEYAEMS